MLKKVTPFTREILITVFLIFLLTVLCVQKINKLSVLAQNSISQKNEQMIRDAIAVYRGDNEGRCPMRLAELKGNYLENLPENYTKGVPSNIAIEGNSYREIFDGTGGWLYINNYKDKDYCEVFRNTKK